MSETQSTNSDLTGRVIVDPGTQSVLMQVPCAHGPHADAVAMSPAHARHLATLLLKAADQLEPSS